MRFAAPGPLSVAIIVVFAVYILTPPASGGPLGAHDHQYDLSPLHFSGRAKREIYPELVATEEIDAGSENDKEGEWQSAPECVVGDVTYVANESVPADQPCLNCKCQPPGVHCETIRCAKKPGCRAIQRPNTCCPDYQCECKHEGRIYANGERLDQTPGSECRVCYCRSGEVQCAEVSCYTRSDCEGRIVPGKCCRKYDHCPPKDPSSILHGNEILDGNHSRPSSPAASADGSDHSMITIHEIIPEVKEIPIMNSPRSNADGVALSSVEGATNDSENSVETIAPEEDTESESSEITEVYQQPPVLRVGDKLLYVQKDGQVVSAHALRGASSPDTVITIVGAEGLQRGFEETREKEGNDRGIAEQAEETTYILSLDKSPATSSASVLPSDNVTDFVFSDGEDLLLPIGDAGNFTGPDRDFLDENTTETLDTTEDYNLTSSQSSPLSAATSRMPDMGSTSSLYENATEIEILATVPTSNVSSAGIAPEKDEIETNPEYPPIPDVMTQPLEEIDAVPQVEKQPFPSEAPSSTPQSQSSSSVATFHSRSIESMESAETADPGEESGEQFTERGTSREAIQPTIYNAGLEDMESPLSPSAASLANSSYSIELVETVPDFIPPSSQSISIDSPSSAAPSIDVEMIDVDLHRGTSAEDTKNLTRKRKRNSDEDESIFHELDREIGLESGTLQEDEGSKEEQEREASQIFKELLEEAASNTTPKTISLVGSKPETAAQVAQAQALGRIGDALAKFRLRDSKNIFDGNLLGIVRDLFTAQYRAYN